MAIGDLAMSLFQNVGNEILHSLNVVGGDRDPSVKYMVDRDDRNFGLHQPADFFGKKVDAGNHNSVDPAVAAVFVITKPLSGEIPACKCDVVPSGFSGTFEAFEYMIKIIMGQSAHGFIYKEDTKIMRSLGFECSCRRIWKIAHLGSCLKNKLSGFFADI